MRENYVKQPPEVEVWPHGGGTDIIMRKNISITQDEDGNDRWECDERQIRVDGSVSIDDVNADFDSWWLSAEKKEPQRKQTPEERISELEEQNKMLTACIMELSQIVYA